MSLQPTTLEPEKLESFFFSPGRQEKESSLVSLLGSPSLCLTYFLSACNINLCWLACSATAEMVLSIPGCLARVYPCPGEKNLKACEGEETRLPKETGLKMALVPDDNARHTELAPASGVPGHGEGGGKSWKVGSSFVIRDGPGCTRRQLGAGV